MKIPKYVQKMIDDRCKLACRLSEVSSNLDDWLMNRDIPLGGDYTMSGCMIYCEPYVAKDCVERDILNKE